MKSVVILMFFFLSSFAHAAPSCVLTDADQASISSARGRLSELAYFARGTVFDEAIKLCWVAGESVGASKMISTDINDLRARIELRTRRFFKDDLMQGIANIKVVGNAVGAECLNRATGSSFEFARATKTFDAYIRHLEEMKTILTDPCKYLGN